VEAVADAADEVRLQVGPAPGRRHGGGRLGFREETMATPSPRSCARSASYNDGS
jgi:hypothetical protein